MYIRVNLHTKDILIYLLHKREYHRSKEAIGENQGLASGLKNSLLNPSNTW
jgi:hypothetical protein